MSCSRAQGDEGLGGGSPLPAPMFQPAGWSQQCGVLTGAEGGCEAFPCGLTALESTCDDVIRSEERTGGHGATARGQQCFRVLAPAGPHLQGNNQQVSLIVMHHCVSSVAVPYLNVAVQTDSAAVWDLEFLIKAHLQVSSLMCYDLPGAFYIGWEILGIIWRLDGSHISMNGTTTTW